MNFDESVLKKEEKITLLLRSLYKKHGFVQYKMSKFEEYDLYARNRDFLVSDNIISFTDKNGVLMALKPDVTLSIVRNTADTPGFVDKLFYSENVYRVPRGALSFKEIMQLGLECIGDIDSYNIFETVYMAAKSLEVISSDCALSISHLGIVTELLTKAGVSKQDQGAAMKLVGEKNSHELRALINGSEGNTEDGAGVSCGAGGKSGGADKEKLIRLLMMNEEPMEAIAALKEAGCDEKNVSELERLCRSLSEFAENSRIFIDFSVVSDMSYYNGLVFKGYINGIPDAVLNGGEYNRLLMKLGRKSRAIGFALYMDYLERFFESSDETDVDALVLYDENADMKLLMNAVKKLMDKGLSVTAEKEKSDRLSFRYLYKLSPNGEILSMNP